MDCLACGGACCEEFFIRTQDLGLPSYDVRRWVTLHGDPSPEYLRLECRCTALTDSGWCGIYASRPDVCRAYRPGGEDCLETLHRRRTPEQRERILNG